MSFQAESSRSRFRAYRDDLKNHRTEGSKGTAAAHAQIKPRNRQRSFGQLLRAFLKITREYNGLIALSLFTLTIATALKLVPPYGMKIVVDHVLGDAPLHDIVNKVLFTPGDRKTTLAMVAIAMIVISAISIAISMWGRWQMTRTTFRLKIDLRRNLFDHAVRLPLHKVHELKSGGVVSFLREDAGGVSELIFTMIYNPWRAIIQLIGTLCILAWIDWRLLTGAVLIIPTVFLTHRTWIARIRPLWRDIRASRTSVDSHATESFGGMRVVRSFGRQRSETGRFVRNNALMVRQESLAWWLSRTIEIVWATLIPVASAILLWYGGVRILNDMDLVQQGALAQAQALTIGDLMMFLFYLGMLLEPLATLASSATSFQNNLAGLDRVLDLQQEPIEMAQSRGGRIINKEHVRGAISMKDVWFAYPNTTRNVIQAVSLDVKPGQCVALVGPSGAGKTTLCDLIARFYDPLRGSIQLDGTDLREIDVESYRQILGIVEQDIFLFDGTIAENIGYGRRGASTLDIQQAAKAANAHGFIAELPHEYNTLIGERGVRLSGGQRQRLAIARALLADPRILILDEATSSLDTESERLIQASLRQLMAGRTTFVIAHRLSTITHANIIIVIEDGRIIERGSHQQLMASSGRYRDMVQLQITAEDDMSPDETLCVERPVY